MTGKRINTRVDGGGRGGHRDTEGTAAACKLPREPTGNWVQAEIGNKGGERTTQDTTADAGTRLGAQSERQSPTGGGCGRRPD